MTIIINLSNRHMDEITPSFMVSEAETNPSILSKDMSLIASTTVLNKMPNFLKFDLKSTTLNSSLNISAKTFSFFEAARSKPIS